MSREEMISFINTQQKKEVIQNKELIKKLKIKKIKKF